MEVVVRAGLVRQRGVLQVVVVDDEQIMQSFDMVRMLQSSRPCRVTPDLVGEVDQRCRQLRGAARIQRVRRAPHVARPLSSGDADRLDPATSSDVATKPPVIGHARVGANEIQERRRR
jgi:hypothetical protein